MIGRSAHEQLSELFTEAVALSPAGRAELLARLRSADASLADELASLLAADEAADPALRTGGLGDAVRTDAYSALGSARRARGDGDGTASDADRAVAPGEHAARRRSDAHGDAAVSGDGAADAAGPTVLDRRPSAELLTAQLRMRSERAAEKPRAPSPPAAGLPGAPAIAGYRILGVLGEGGMGTVYAAEQQAPRRPVAIKVLHARSPSALARFRAEAEIMARLDHPGIARVLEAGEAGGHPFLVMEHVDGVTLDRHAVALPRRARLALFAALCDAVHHAHVHGVIHRDLKPANVMVRPGDRGRDDRVPGDRVPGDRVPGDRVPGDRVIVLDFGVARLAASDAAAGSETRAGELIGTPLYMSPEQARLRPNEVDARSDVYTLGVMLYELLCGELPYASVDVPLFAVAGMICEDEPVPLGERDPSLAGDLAAIADRALRKTAAERYQSVAALADDVRRHLDGAPVSVRTPGAREQLRRFCRRRPLLAGGIAAAVLGTAAFAITVTELWLAAARAERRADAARAALESRTAQLTLRQARAALARDPTEALAWLATLTSPPSALGALDPAAVWGVAEEALGRGVASHVLAGHAGEVHWIEGIPGTVDFATGAYDGRVIVWHGPDAAPREVFRAPHGRVRVVRPSPDGERLAIAADDGVLRIVDRAGVQLAELPGHRGDVQTLGWSADGAWLASGDNRGQVWLWPHGGGPGRALQRGSAAVSALAFSADGAALIGGNHAGEIWLWPVVASAGAPVIAPAGSDVIDAWTDGRRAMSVDGDGTVRTWRVERDALAIERTVATGQAVKHAAIFSPAGASDGAPWAVLGSVSGSALRVEGAAIDVIATHHAQVRWIAIAPDGRRIATASDDGVIQVTDRATGRHLTLRGHSARVRHVAFAGRALLSSDGEGVARRWELDDVPATVLDGAGAPVDRMAASRDGRSLAAIDSAGEVALWTLGDRAPPVRGDPAAGGRRVVGAAAGHVSAIAIAGAVPVVITGSAEGDVAWWSSPVVHRSVKGVVRALAVCGDRIAAATSAGPIALFTGAGEPVAELPGNTGGTESIACDPAGALLAAGGQDRAIRVYRLDGELAQIAELSGPVGDTHFVAFSPSGDRVVAAGNDGTVRSWPVVAGRVGAADPAAGRHTGAVSAVAFSFDGRWLASAGRDDLVRRRALGAGREDALAIGGTASAIAFGAAGGVQMVTRAGAVVRATPAGTATLIEHGARAAVAVYPDRMAVALDDGAIVLESLDGSSPDALARAIEAATHYRLPH